MAESDSIAKQEKKQDVWARPEGQARALRPGLYVCATPIGNLRDISLRALDTLAAADIVACEDTRVSGKLLAAYGISKKLVVYNDHSDEKARARLIEVARESVVVVISDAGMPLISDPGYKLIRAAISEGVYTSSLPGANAPLTALQLSGMPSDRFSFIGFLPSKSGARAAALRGWAQVDASLIAFETAPRLIKALEDIARLMPGREVAVARELTKMYEEVKRGSASELLEFYTKEGAPKGEIVLVIAPPQAQAFSDEAVMLMLSEELKRYGTKEAAAIVAEKTGRAKKALYALALEVSKDDG